MEIYGLKTNYQVNPCGISLKGLTLSWKVKDAAGCFQKTIRILISEKADFGNPCYDSGQLSWEGSSYTPDVRLEPGRRYYWQVAVTDDSGDFAESKAASFEGGHPAGDWHGTWIKPPFAPCLHPVFQKSFELTDAELTDAAARLYICGLGLYEVYVNGQKAGEEYLTPYYTDYRFWIQYQTIDVTGDLRPGSNRIDVYLGNGWYKGKFGYLNKGELRDYYGHEFKLLADLYISREGEADRVIGTDTGWLALKSPVCSSGIYDGEVYDARMEADIEDGPDRRKLYAVRAEKPQGELMPMVGVPVKRREVLKVKEIIVTPIGETVLDFGQEITGWVSFRACGPVGQRITLAYGEVLQDGRFYRENLRTAQAEYTFIANGKEQLARPHFTFYGFRYVKVTGMRVDESNVDGFEAWALYSDMEETGHIQTSNEKVNRLIENTRWSQKDNFLDIPTDCPQRDERLGWTGDAQIFSGAASYHMQTAAFFRKYLKDMGLEQRTKGGAVPYVVPDVLTLGRLMNGEPEFDYTEDLWGEAGASVWGDAATIIPWNMYLFFGNKALLAEQYDNMKQWIDFVIRMDETHCGGRRLWDCGFHFGDWLSLDAEKDDRQGGTDKYLVASIYYMHSAELTAKAAGVLGRTEDQAYYEKIAGEVRAAVRARYVTREGALNVNTQTAYVLGIHFHIFEEHEMAAAAQKLECLLADNGHKLLTGFVGTGYLCPALSETGQDREAYTLLLNEEYPGWLYEVNLGATTIWERWNSLLPDGSISDTGMNSLNHYAYGVIVEWIYRYACGLQPTEEGAGFRKVIFSPRSDSRLDYVEAVYESVNGRYVAGWRRTGSRLRYTLEVPFNCEAVFCPNRALAHVTVNGRAVEDYENMKLFCGSYVIEADTE